MTPEHKRDRAAELEAIMTGPFLVERLGRLRCPECDRYSVIVSDAARLCVMPDCGWTERIKSRAVMGDVNR